MNKKFEDFVPGSLATGTVVDIVLKLVVAVALLAMLYANYKQMVSQVEKLSERQNAQAERLRELEQDTQSLDQVQGRLDRIQGSIRRVEELLMKRAKERSSD